MRVPFAAVLVLLAAPLAAQRVEISSTLCQTAPVAVFSDLVNRRLIGCGDGFPENLLWNLDRSDSASGTLDRRMKRALTGRGAVVYVADVGGIMRTHDEFVRAAGSNVIAGFNADGTPSEGCEDPLAPCTATRSQVDLDGHGTAVASVIAGRRTGVAPDASLVAARVKTGGDAGWAAAMQAIIAHAFDPATPHFRTAVINMASVPALDASPGFEAIMRRMIGGVDANGNPDPNGKRFLFVVLAGNVGIPGLQRHCGPDGGVRIYPAIDGVEIEGLITVSGITRENKPWDGACKGPLVEVLAPAQDVLVASTTGNDHYRTDPWNSGTSYATAYVSGMAARLLEADGTLTPAQLEQRLKASASRVNGLPVPVMVVDEGRRRAVRR